MLGCEFEESETTRRSPESRPLVDKAACTNEHRCADTAAVCVVWWYGVIPRSKLWTRRYNCLYNMIEERRSATRYST